MVIFILIVLGLCFGSFVNALVWRLHEKRDWVRERSMCVHCHHELAWYDLLPVISWISLKGKCRYCHKPISVQYPIVEIVTAGLFVLSYAFWPSTLNHPPSALFVSWLAFLVLFMAMLVYDLRWMLLPNNLTYTVTALAAVQAVAHAVVAQDVGIVVGAVAGLLSVGGLFYVLFQISSGKWIGGGDVKLGFGLGLLAGGIFEGLLVIFVASLLGTIFALPLMVTKKLNLKRRVAFGPFLIVAMIIVYLFGADIISWYQHQVLLLP